MLDFQQKRKVRSFLYNRITIGVMLAVLVVVGHSTWVVYKKKVDSQEMMTASLANVESLRKRSDELNYKIERLGTKQGIEEEVRSKFSVAKENENVVIIVQDEPTSSKKIEKVSLWKKITGVFGKN